MDWDFAWAAVDEDGRAAVVVVRRQPPTRDQPLPAAPLDLHSLSFSNPSSSFGPYVEAAVDWPNCKWHAIVR